MEVFKNNQDQILLGSSGNILIRPYDFGNAFVNSSTNYILVQRDFNQYLNLYVWLYDRFTTPGTPGSGAMFVWDAKNYDGDIIANRYYRTFNNYMVSVNMPANDGSPANKLIQRSGYQSNSGWVAGVNLMKVMLSDTGINRFAFNYGSEFSFAETSPNRSVLSQIEIGKSHSNYNTSPDVRIGRFMLFNRELSADEYRYVYNNGLGRDLLTTEGLLLDLHNNQAETLDFSEAQDGSDMRVGVRDFSGNNYHGEIMNLPAGTLEEKLEYANDNLFKSFV